MTRLLLCAGLALMFGAISVVLVCEAISCSDDDSAADYLAAWDAIWDVEPTKGPCDLTLELLNARIVDRSVQTRDWEIDVVSHPYLIVQMRISNDSDQPAAIAGGNLTLADDASRPYEWVALFDATDALDGTLQPGASLVGWQGFAIAEDVETAVLRFDNRCARGEWQVP